MKKPSNNKKRPARKGQEAVPLLKVKKGASLKAIYAAARRAFTAADLQKYTEIEEGVPANSVLAELEAIDREETRQRVRKAKHGRSRQ
jgi:hypothetical protein